MHTPVTYDNHRQNIHIHGDLILLKLQSIGNYILQPTNYLLTSTTSINILPNDDKVQLINYRFLFKLWVGYVIFIYAFSTYQ